MPSDLYSKETKKKQKKGKRRSGLIDYKVLYGVVRNIIAKRNTNSFNFDETEEIKELYRKSMSMLFPPEPYVWKSAIRWMEKEEIIKLTSENEKYFRKKTVLFKERKYGYIEIGKDRIMIEKGWKEKLDELIKRRELSVKE